MPAFLLGGHGYTGSFTKIPCGEANSSAKTISGVRVNFFLVILRKTKVQTFSQNVHGDALAGPRLQGIQSKVHALERRTNNADSRHTFCE